MTMTERAEAPGRNRFLAALSPSDFAVLAPDLHDLTMTVPNLLQEMGETIGQVYFPHKGMISQLTVMTTGDAVETATIGREGVSGGMAGFGIWVAPYRAIVQLSGTVSRISAAKFEFAISNRPFIRELLVKYTNVSLSSVQQSAGCNALHPVAARLCRWLLQTRDRHDSDRIPLTQEFLSQMLGVRRTTVTMVARELQAAGLIRYSRGKIDLLDRRAVEQKACECYAILKRRSDDVFRLNDAAPSEPF